MRKFKDVAWNFNTVQGKPNTVTNCQEARLAVLMDIRDELKKLNGLLRCQNFIDIPHVLKDIRRNTHKPPPKRKTRKK